MKWNKSWGACPPFEELAEKLDDHDRQGRLDDAGFLAAAVA